MIITGILYIIYLILLAITAPLRLLGNATLPPDLYSALLTAGSYLNSVNLFLPISTIFIILGIVLTIEAFHFTWKLINWVRKLLPTQS